MNYEQEEEYLTNDLSRKLAQVMRLEACWGLCNCPLVVGMLEPV